MNETLLYTLPQWFIFAGIFMIIYGWVENKKPFRLIGSGILVLLGVFSLYIIAGDFLDSGQFLSPEEIASEDLDDEISNEIPFQAKLIPAYWSFVIASILSIPALILDFKNKQKYRLFIILSGMACLFGFFVIIGAVRSL